MAKCVKQCIGKFVRVCGLEDGLLKAVIFAKKVFESVLCGKNCVRALRGLLILQYTIKIVKWKSFWEEHNVDDHTAALKNLDAAMLKKDKKCPKTVLKLQQKYNEFNQPKKEKSELYQF